MKKQPAVQDKKEIQKSQKNIELKGLLFLAAGLFLLASYAGLPTGFIGKFLHDAMTYGFGLGAIVFPFIFIAMGIGYFRLKKNLVWFGGFWAAMLFYICLLCAACRGRCDRLCDFTDGRYACQPGADREIIVGGFDRKSRGYDSGYPGGQERTAEC